MDVKDRKINELIPAEYNSRWMSDGVFEQLKASLRRFEAVEPIIVNTHPDRENIIVGGHQRIRAAKALGWDSFPCVEVNLSRQEERELNIRLNKNTGSWDWDELASYFSAEELIDWGFDDEELYGDGVYENEQAEEDDFGVPSEDQIETDIELGDLIEIGRHRLLCGDSADKEQVEYLMNGRKVDLYLTDPPYSVNYAKKNKEVLSSKEYTEIKNDDLSTEDTAEAIWGPCFKNAYKIAKDHCVFYMTMPQGGDQMMMMMMMMMNENWQVKHELIWVKNSAVFSMNRLDYDYKHEPIIYGWKKKHRFFGRGKHKESVWVIERDGDKSHPTMKPVELLENCIINSTKKDELVYDSFLGSGSTMVAAHQLARTCYGMELDPRYCQVIIDRMINLDSELEIKVNGDPYEAP